MATQENVQTITRDAAEDLTANQFTFVDVDGNGLIEAGEASLNAIGVLLNKPNTGEACTIAISGVVKVVAGTGGITAGQIVQSGALGVAIATPITGDFALGRALTSGLIGETVEVLLGNHAATA